MFAWFGESFDSEWQFFLADSKGRRKKERTTKWPKSVLFRWQCPGSCTTVIWVLTNARSLQLRLWKWPTLLHPWCPMWICMQGRSTIDISPCSLTSDNYSNYWMGISATLKFPFKEIFSIQYLFSDIFERNVPYFVFLIFWRQTLYLCSSNGAWESRQVCFESRMLFLRIR